MLRRLSRGAKFAPLRDAEDEYFDPISMNNILRSIDDPVKLICQRRKRNPPAPWITFIMTRSMCPVFSNNTFARDINGTAH